ncbi:MAG: GNAT family protein [Candidatus Zixiibacteriota bacterium]
MIEKIAGRQINLRRIRRADAPSLVKHINDITVARNTFIPHPYGLKDAHAFIRTNHLNWRKGERYGFGIEDPATGEIIGGIGLEMISRKHRCFELGYWLSRKYRGRGMATEAVRLAVGFGFKELKLVRIQAHVFTGNDVSVRVLEKCGFTFEGTARKRIKHRGRWRDLMMYSILRGEWRPQ